MENQNQYYPPQVAPQDQIMLPHSIAVLICGILAIQCSFIYGIPGLAFAIVAMVLARKSGHYLEQSPWLYSPGTIKMYRAGRTCAIIGLVLSIVMIIAFIFLFYYLITQTGHHQYPQPPPPPQPHYPHYKYY